LIYVFKCAIQVLRWSNERESSFVSNLAKLQRKFNEMMKTAFEEDVSSCTVTFDLNVLRKAGSHWMTTREVVNCQRLETNCESCAFFTNRGPSSDTSCDI